ncbi:MAG: hypothetical protein LQ347_003570 [Umbilicaria vellea]|nr:MAG: hypothetical protein LQ347_003570 [Umbilicaria vellea]
MDSQTARKRRKLSADVSQASFNSSAVESSQAVASPTPDAAPKITTLSRSISPPARRIPRAPDIVETSRLSGLARVDQDQSMPNKSSSSRIINKISSPVQLSRVEELAASSNIDTVSLEDILGDPLIKECWAFNYLFDVDFLM